MVNSENIIKDWVETHTNALFNWAFYKLSDEETAKDIVQETFIAAYQKLDSFKWGSNPKTWLFAIINNKIIDHYRKQSRSPVDKNSDFESAFFDNDGMWRDEKRPLEWEYQDNLLDNDEFIKILNGCMKALPQHWASAIQLKYLLRKDGYEVCEELNISLPNYWQIIRRAKLQLRQCLELKWFK